MAAEKLSLERLRELQVWVGERIAALEAGEEPVPVPRSVAVPIEERQIGSIVYRLVKVQCGTPGCKCNFGAPHGPYWYAHWLQDGRPRTKYVGRKFVEISQDK